jgi:hypothetical protein
VDNVEDIGLRIKEITEAIIKLEGKGATFSQNRIEVKVSSPSSPDLTIIDLPGIVRTRTEGQSHNVVAEVDSMIERYLKQEHTILF